MKWGGMLVASLLMVSSCQNEEIVQNQSAQGQAFTLTASKGMGSRTAIDGNQTVWSEGDKIYVSSRDGKVTGVLTLTDGADDVTGTFSGFVFGNPNQLAYSVYPAPKSGTTLDLSEVAGAHQLDAPMIGKINQDGDVDVQFNHACGVLYVNLPGSTGQDFTITATNGGTAINLAATANVAASSIRWNGEVPSLNFASTETEIEVTDAKGGIMYIPYYTNEANLTNVTFKVEDTPLNTTPINLTQDNGPIGKIVQSNILTLTYDNGKYEATTVPEVEVTNGELTISADELDGNIKNINIPTVKDEDGQVVEVKSITVELPKFDEQGQTRVISFDEIAEGTTVTIKEDGDASEEHSIKELTVILPSADAPVEIDMPNTTVTIISADSNELVIEEIVVGTADDTFVVEENVYIKTLKVRKGNVEVKGRVDNIIREGYNEGGADIYVYIIGNGKVGSIGEGVKYANKANGEVSTAEDLIAALDISEGDKVTITLNADITLNETAIVKQGTNVTLDLNGRTLSHSDEEGQYVINNLGTLIIKGNGTVNSRGIYNGYDANGNYVLTAKLTIENGTFNAKGTNGGAAVYNYGVTEINGGSFESNGSYCLNNQATGAMYIGDANVKGGVYNKGNLEIDGAEIFQHMSGRHAVYVWESTLTINSGEFDSKSGNELILADGEGASVTLNDGTYNKTAKSWLFGAATNKNITFTINGGTYNGYVNLPENTVDTFRPYGDPIVVNGGTFNFDPTRWLAEGLEVASVNNTWIVVDEAMTFAEFNNILKEQNSYDAGDKNVVVVLDDSDRSYYNNATAQFFIGTDDWNGTNAVESINVKNVTFKFNDDVDDKYTSGELQVFTTNMTFVGCTFEGVAVCPWGNTNQDDCESAIFTDCIWKNLSGRYGIHQNMAHRLTVTDCDFLNCERGIHTNSVSPEMIEIKGNTFTGIGNGYGMLCLAENGDYSETELNISGNDADGQVCLRQLNKTISLSQVAAIFANNIFGTEYVANSIVPTE